MLLHVTTRIQGRKHDDLLQTVGGRGFPSFFALDASGEVIGRHQGTRDAAGFAATMQDATAFVALRRKANAGDKAAQVDYLIARARFGNVDVDAFRAEIGKLEMTQEQTQAYRSVLANAMYDRVQATAVGKAFLQMEKDGLVPDDGSKRPRFYYQIFRYAAAKKDVPLMERARAEVSKAWSANPRYKTLLASLERQIENAKKEAEG
ncbi:MAG: hypothetical protein ACYTG3_14410 [Planctomycetota bacterium]|jgi:hypothetical protein